MGMRVSLAGVCRNAKNTILRLAGMVRETTDRANDSDEDPAGDAEEFAFMLGEIKRHAEETKAGQHTVTDFAEFYYLAEPAKPLVLTETDYPLE